MTSKTQATSDQQEVPAARVPGAAFGQVPLIGTWFVPLISIPLTWTVASDVAGFVTMQMAARLFSTKIMGVASVAAMEGVDVNPNSKEEAMIVLFVMGLPFLFAGVQTPDTEPRSTQKFVASMSEVGNAVGETSR
ncbi:MAG TPA: hypothetical protein VEL28_00640 [Candidatus Binatia bacterium]|nr:hypothetical protein [Candidatus Binatia bacterium]